MGDTWEDLSNKFKLCSTLDGLNSMDVKSFMELLIDNLAGIVQYNGRYEEDIFSTCAIMTDESMGEPILRLAAVNDVMLSMGQDECLDHSYASYLSQLTNTTFWLRCWQKTVDLANMHRVWLVPDYQPG